MKSIKLSEKLREIVCYWLPSKRLSINYLNEPSRKEFNWRGHNKRVTMTIIAMDCEVKPFKPRLRWVLFVQLFSISEYNSHWEFLSGTSNKIPSEILRWLDTIYGIKFKSVSEIDLHWFNRCRMPYNISIIQLRQTNTPKHI